MRFPFKAYADMIAQEEKSVTHHVATNSAGENKDNSESALNNDDDIAEHDDIEDVGGSDEEI